MTSDEKNLNEQVNDDDLDGVEDLKKMDGAEDEDVESVEGEVVEEEQDKKGSETAELDEKLTAALDQYKRLFAEFDNYRKRTEVEKSDMYASGIRKTVEKILPVLDNFERGLAAVPEADRKNSAYTGMEIFSPRKKS